MQGSRPDTNDHADSGSEGLLAGRYRLDRLIGRGGMADVYEGQDIRLGRRVAVKLIPPAPAGDAALAERFLSEARAVASLVHPHIVTVYDVGEDNGQRFIVMEYVEGTSLQQHLDREGPLAVAEAANIGIQVADALAYAHEHGIIHADINPRNIMVRPDGQVKLVDFGIARAAVANSARTTVLLGTPQYLAPEQVEGQVPDQQTDIYAVGLVLYAMLTGRLPFQNPSPWLVMTERLRVTPEPVRRHNPAVPETVEKVVMRALARDRATRYQSASELAGDLQQAYSALLQAQTMRLPQAPKTRHPPSGEAQAGAGIILRKPRRSLRIARPVLLLLLLALFSAGLVWAQNVFEGHTTPLVQVPAVEGKLVDAAARELQAAGLRIDDEIVPSREPIGTVLQQKPPPDATVKQGSTVTLIISGGN